MLKRSFVFILFLLFTCFITIDFEMQVVEEKPNAFEVIKYMNNDFYDFPDKENKFYLLFDVFKLDSNNFVKIISFFSKYDHKIEEIYPYINPIYQSVLEDVSIIKYDGEDYTEGINEIYKIYMKALEKNHLSGEIDKILVNGMRIRMIKIRVKNSVLFSFLKKNQGVKFSNSYYGLFKTAEV